MELVNWKEFSRKELGDYSDTLGIKLNKRQSLKKMQDEFESKYSVADIDGIIEVIEPQQVESYIEVKLSDLKVKDTFFLNGECKLERTAGVKSYWYNKKDKKHYTGSNYRVVEVKQ